MSIKMALAFLMLLWSVNEAIAEQAYSVTIPIWEPSQLTCSWWLANKGKPSREKAETTVAAFMAGYYAGRRGAANLEFETTGPGTSGGVMKMVAGWTTGRVDDFCEKSPQEAWTRAFMVIYQSSPVPLTPPPPVPPGTKRQVYDKDLKRWVDLE